MIGKFLVIDGMDGSGKSVFLDEMKEQAQALGLRVFDLHSYWQQHKRHPMPDEINADIILSSEPTFVLAGALIREELINSKRRYSAHSIAQAYALDRQILYEQVIIPARKKGIHVIQARSVSTSLIYQPLDARRKGEQMTFADVAKMPGNDFALAHPPDALVILLLPPKEAMQRLAGRNKQDDATFETQDFQQQVQNAFTVPRLRELYEKSGTKLIYPDVTVSVDRTRAQAREIFKTFIPHPQ